MDGGDDPSWRAILAGEAPPGPLFAPLFAPPIGADGCIVIGRLAQTLDGRIATRNGASRWIGGPGDVLHTHRLRALCHAVVVGAGTIAADDPQLTTRLVEGPSPVRVVLDPKARLGSGFRVFREGPPTLLVVGRGATAARRHGRAEVLALPEGPEGLDLSALLHALAARGLRRIFVEGGGVTVSRFLMAGLLDRLHVTVAPLILGSGRPAFALPEAERIADGLRLSWSVHEIAPDLLLDIAVGRARPALAGA
ncbi:MAG: RibD family protein [Rhodovarius sp.]|nr:RibD family protein [Rhodovarius sp.]MCX7932433.1 RibD family protein [Rhodovarius sp.]MDW8313729.1 RibD family protein [Rhodovarius sp.]